jgi:nicotinamidase-related amidase
MLRLTRDITAFLCCDIQEIFKKTIFQFDHVANTANLLIMAGRVLNIPTIVSEQYPAKLGKTFSGIDVTGCSVYPKTRFSMITEGFPDQLLSQRDSFVLFGIETHVCVQQTALDLLEMRKSVVMVTDGVSSSRPLDRSTALSRLSFAGAILMTAESVLFEIMRTKDCGEFKEISAIAKEISSFNLSGRAVLSTL